MFNVNEGELPVNTLVSKAFSKYDYADSFMIRIPDYVDVDTLARVVLTSVPRWVNILMRVRDVIAGIFGLRKGTKNLQQGNLSFVPGKKAGFTVFDRTGEEILLGEKDKHLDFYLSFLICTQEGTRRGVVSTVVCYNNWLGRAYFIPVKIFHRIIVQSLLGSALKKL